MAAAVFDEREPFPRKTLYVKHCEVTTLEAKKMSSTGSTFSAFHDLSPPGCGPNNSFSIRRILDLPEKSDEKYVAFSSSSSSAECYPPVLPLVPRVVRPMVHSYDDNVPCTGFVNCQDYGLTRYAQRWSHRVLHSTNHGFPLEMLAKKRRRPMRKKKQRPLFSPHQIQTMENEFAKQRYVTEDKRAQLALEINLTENQVKTWFQNRRTKWKKETKGEAITVSTRYSKGKMEDALVAMQNTNPFCSNTCVDLLVHQFRGLPQYCAPLMFSNIDVRGCFVP